MESAWWSRVLRALSLLICLASASACAVKADVRVTNFDAPVSVRVGQTLGIQPPAPNGDWQVDFDNESLRLITPESDLAHPGTQGWVWRAIRAGESELVLTSTTRCAPEPCTPAVLRFTVRLDVKPEG